MPGFRRPAYEHACKALLSPAPGGGAPLARSSGGGSGGGGRGMSVFEVDARMTAFVDARPAWAGRDDEADKSVATLALMALGTPDSRAALAGLRSPVLLIASLDDALVPPSHAHELAGQRAAPPPGGAGAGTAASVGEFVAAAAAGVRARDARMDFPCGPPFGVCNRCGARHLTVCRCRSRTRRSCAARTTC